VKWTSSIFDTDSINNDECPIIKNAFEDNDIHENNKGIELRNSIFKTINYVNYKDNKMELFFDVTLKGESTFWLFLRNNDVFSKYTAVIKIIKEEKCQKTFIHFGTFVVDSKANLIFKTFLKQQLINYAKNKNKSFYENDYCVVKALVLDVGDEKIVIKVYLNESEIEKILLLEISSFQ